MVTATEIAKIMTKLASDKKSADEIALLVSKKYPKKVPAIIKSLERMRDLDADYVQVFSARDLSETEKSEIKKYISEKYDDGVTIKFAIDEKIKGGVIIKVGETVIDNSLSTKIDKIKKKIREINLNQE